MLVILFNVVIRNLLENKVEALFLGRLSSQMSWRPLNTFHPIVISILLLLAKFDGKSRTISDTYDFVLNLCLYYSSNFKVLICQLLIILRQTKKSYSIYLFFKLGAFFSAIPASSHFLSYS